MGVRSCSRKGCPNIMCDTYVQGIGYICRDCQDEFKEMNGNKGLHLNTHTKIRHELERFMDTEKDIYRNDEETSLDDFFREHTN